MSDDPLVQETDDLDCAPAEGGDLTTDQVRLALRRVKDPEVGLNIVDLGLIYEVSVDGADVNVDMSLTSPGCPAGPQILHEAEEQLRTLPGVGGVTVNLVWSPPWTPWTTSTWAAMSSGSSPACVRARNSSSCPLSAAPARSVSSPAF